MTHQEAWDLIPWLVNDSIDVAARERLGRHLVACASCREEEAAQRALRQAMHAGPRVEAMPPASLQKLWSRIDADVPEVARAETMESGRRPFPGAWLIAGVAAASVLAGAALVILMLPLQDSGHAAYRTVSDAAAPAPAGDVRVVFAGQMTLTQLQDLLDRTGMHIVSGPTASGVYTLAGADAQSVLAALRADPWVRFAEPAGP